MTEDTYKWRRPFEVVAPMDAFLQVGAREVPLANGGVRWAPVFTHVRLDPGDEIDLHFERTIRIVRANDDGQEAAFVGRVTDPSDDGIPNETAPLNALRAIEREGCIAERADILMPSNPAVADKLAWRHLDPDLDTVIADWPEDTASPRMAMG